MAFHFTELYKISVKKLNIAMVYFYIKQIVKNITEKIGSLF